MCLPYIAALLVFQTSLVGSIPGGLGVPENITVTFLNPTAVKVSWAIAADNVDKYDVIYKPTDAKVVTIVAGNSGAVTLTGLVADTQYQLTVAAVCAGRKYRSGPVVFRTLEPPRTSPQLDGGMPGTGTPPYPAGMPPPPSDDAPQPFPTIRGVEVGIVLLVLMVWIGAIALFFNRWGKIRMLLPYQPDYKQEQLKVPGTGACAAAAASSSCAGNHGGHACSQHFHWSSHQMSSLDCDEHSPSLLAARRARPRVNSACYVSNSDSGGFAGFDAGDFLRRYGSQSKLCRKARSADNIPLTTMEEGSNERLSRGEGSPTEVTHHFGLPILSVSGPSPPDEDYERIDEYL